MSYIFYKGVLLKYLKNNYIPGTVTTDFKTALTWKERISGNKKKGAAKHIEHGQSCIIVIKFEDVIYSHEHFQVAGISEHQRLNCWTSAAKDKAQINTVCEYKILNSQEIDHLFRL